MADVGKFQSEYGSPVLMEYLYMGREYFYTLFGENYVLFLLSIDALQYFSGWGAAVH